MLSLGIFGNQKMDAALERYEQHFRTIGDLALFGLATDKETANLFEKLVDRAIKTDRSLTDSDLIQLYSDVPPPGKNVVY